MSKRKHSSLSTSTEHTGPDPELFIQAHEADLIHGPEAARALESSSDTSKLIRWSFNDNTVEGKDIWVDRYDARLLLESLPTIANKSQSSSPPGSPSGWSDLPSDAEDTFFFDTEEVEDYRRDKRRRLIAQSHEERLKAMNDMDRIEEEEEVWGGSDEEPDDAQKEFMKRTASHILSSPNPAQLEMRILVNHGSDKRFAFLRGRWPRFWKSTKLRLKLQLNPDKDSNGLEELAEYGSEDSGSEGQETPQVDPMPAAEDEAIKEARRERLRKWIDDRRAAKTAMVQPKAEEN